MELGTLTQVDDDRWAIHYTRRLAHPIEKVWSSVTEPDELKHWFPAEVSYERREGEIGRAHV